MASDSPGPPAAGCAGAMLGGLAGAGAGVLALVLFPWKDLRDGSHGTAAVGLMLAVVVVYGVVGLILGACTGPSPHRGPLGAGAAAGLLGGLAVSAVLPRVLDATAVFPAAFLIPLGCAIAGAVIGRVRK